MRAQVFMAVNTMTEAFCYVTKYRKLNILHDNLNSR
jgi:hypothetical protein